MKKSVTKGHIIMVPFILNTLSWGHGSSGGALAKQAQVPEFKSKYHQKEKK
jgi:hypothetical protein